LAHGREDLGLAAIATAGAREHPVWRDAKRGEALLALGGHGEAARAALAQILGGLGSSAALAPIGEALGKHPDPATRVVGRRWYRYAMHYGAALAQTKLAGSPGIGSPSAQGSAGAADRFFAASVEDRPREAAA